MTLHTLSIGRVALLAALALTVGGAAQAQRVVRDAQSGQLRAPSADEAKLLDTRASRPVGLRSGLPNPPAVQHADGTIEQELDTSTLVYSVARRNPDGSITQYCVTGTEKAERLVAASPRKAATPAARASAKEQSYAVK